MANGYISGKIDELKAVSHRQGMRQPIVDILTELERYALPEVTAEDTGKTLVVDDQGKWTIGELKNGGGGVILYPLKGIELVNNVIRLGVRINITQTEEQMAVVDMSRATIRKAGSKAVMMSTWLGLGGSVVAAENTIMSSKYVSCQVARSDSGTSAAISISFTATWNGNGFYIMDQSGQVADSKVMYEVSGCSFSAGDTIAFAIGVEFI